MPEVKLAFTPFGTAGDGVLVLFCSEELKFGSASDRAIGPIRDQFKRAAQADGFKGKTATALVLPAPQGLAASRLVVIGAGAIEKLDRADILNLGGSAMGKVPASARQVTIFAELPSKGLNAEQAADLALGARLRAYSFDVYKTKRKEGEEKPAAKTVPIAAGDVAVARKAYAAREAIAEGVVIARDLGNEPANVLYPAEFASPAGALKQQKVAVDVLDVAAMKKLGM